MNIDWDAEDEKDALTETEFRAALNADRFDEARALIDERASDADSEHFVTSMLEDLGLTLAHRGRYEESIAAFERAIELGWEVVPDARCEIARVLLLAGRHPEADALWTELREADPGGVWTLNAGGLAYNEVDRHQEAVEWLAEGLNVAMARDDPEHVVDQMSDARRLSLRRLGSELDELERDVEAFRARAAAREQERRSELRAMARRAGIPVRGGPTTIAWLAQDDDETARERWPGWAEGLNRDEPFDQRRARMERHLRERRLDGDGPFVVVTIEPDRYAAWCEANSYEPADRRSRASFVDHEREQGGGRHWPPGRNEACWCGSELKYKRCCGGLVTHAVEQAIA